MVVPGAVSPVLSPTIVTSVMVASTVMTPNHQLVTTVTSNQYGTGSPSVILESTSMGLEPQDHLRIPQVFPMSSGTPTGIPDIPRSLHSLT